MNTVVIDGVTYTKAGILAKQFRYTTDYIGQLCRGGKVDAQLVGRSWYVSKESLEQHSGKRIDAIRQDEKILNDKSFTDDLKNVQQVFAPLSKQTKKMLQNAPAVQSSHYSGVRYEYDPVDLLPVMPVRPILPMTIPSDNKTINIVQHEASSPMTETKPASHIVPINQNRLIKIQAVEDAPQVRVIAPMKPHVLDKPLLNKTKSPTSIKPSSVLTLPESKASVSFTPASVSTATPVVKSRKVPYKVLALGIVFLSLGALLSALMLDIEVHYNEVLTSTTFTFNQTALLNFFK
ncbi:MAG: hypothetical protein ACK42D_00800 [Candidatus Paceibacteria bacterium]